MGRKVIVGAVAVATILGLSAYRSLPKHLQNASPAQSATVEGALSDQRVISAGSETFYPVTKVVDGDTMAVDINGKNTIIRLIGLDTPETVDPRKPVQCFGKEASNKARELLDGKRVRIEMDPSQGERDKYGRLLAYIYLEDGSLFNQMMIERGFGHEYTYNLPYRYQKEFKEEEKTARENKLGLWAPGVCASPDTGKLSTPAPVAQPALNTDGYDCSRNAYNCSSFKTQAEAQYVFELCGSDKNDVHKLDRDMDEKVCESLP
ncbi:MAG: thermonuclease family protein [Patescibacteria group bacterium]